MIHALQAARLPYSDGLKRQLSSRHATAGRPAVAVRLVPPPYHGPQNLSTTEGTSLPAGRAAAPPRATGIGRPSCSCSQRGYPPPTTEYGAVSRPVRVWSILILYSVQAVFLLYWYPVVWFVQDSYRTESRTRVRFCFAAALLSPELYHGTVLTLVSPAFHVRL